MIYRNDVNDHIRFHFIYAHSVEELYEKMDTMLLNPNLKWYLEEVSLTASGIWTAQFYAKHYLDNT